MLQPPPSYLPQTSTLDSLLPSTITALAHKNKVNHTAMSIFIGKWDGKCDFQQWALPLLSALRVYGLDAYLNPNYPYPTTA